MSCCVNSFDQKGDSYSVFERNRQEVEIDIINFAEALTTKTTTSVVAVASVCDHSVVDNTIDTTTHPVDGLHKTRVVGSFVSTTNNLKDQFSP